MKTRDETIEILQKLDYILQAAFEHGITCKIPEKKPSLYSYKELLIAWIKPSGRGARYEKSLLAFSDALKQYLIKNHLRGALKKAVMRHPLRLIKKA